MTDTTERNDPVGPWLDYPGAAEYTKIPEGSLRKHVMGRTVPHRKVGRRVLFLAAELDRWIDEGGAFVPRSAA